MADTKIEWCDKVWNPVVGCTKCSPGCLNCYAERFACRLAYMGQEKYQKVTGYINDWTHWLGDIYCDKSMLDQPLHWRKPKRIFVCSMSDLFHPKVPFNFITRVHDRIDICQEHTFLILTKRIEKAKEYYLDYLGGSISENIHLGVSISTQAEADEKIPILLEIPAAVLWLSIEPMLGPIKIPKEYLGRKVDSYFGKAREKELSDEQFISGDYPDDFIAWVVVGGESGPGARPMHPDWARNIRDQCVAAGVPFYFKQWGEWIDHSLTDIKPTKKNAKIIFQDGSTWPWSILSGRKYDIAVKNGGRTVIRVGKKKAGCILDNCDWKQLPERR